MSRNPRTTVGQELLREFGVGGICSERGEKAYARRMILAIEDEAAATERRLTVERVPDDVLDKAILDAAYAWGESPDRRSQRVTEFRRSILDDLATADVDEEAGK